MCRSVPRWPILRPPRNAKRFVASAGMGPKSTYSLSWWPVWFYTRAVGAVHKLNTLALRHLRYFAAVAKDWASGEDAWSPSHPTWENIGAVIDSMTSHLWQFEGTFDVTGNILTWETEGPVPSPQTPSKFREVTELKSPDHKVFTSSILGPDGSWNTIMTINIRRKKQ